MWHYSPQKMDFKSRRKIIITEITVRYGKEIHKYNIYIIYIYIYTHIILVDLKIVA